jgi:hypothetical protein
LLNVDCRRLHFSWLAVECLLLPAGFLLDCLLRLSATDCWLLPAGFRLLVAGCRLPAAAVGCRLQAFGSWLPVVDCLLRLMATDCRLPAVGFQLLVAGFRLLGY